MSHSFFAAPNSYWQASRAPRYSLLFALPLLLFYQTLAVLLSRGPGGSLRNGADVLMQSLFVAVAGKRGPLVFMVCLIGVGLWLVARDMRAHGRPRRIGVYTGMLGESVLLALVFGGVVGGVTARLLSPLAALAYQLETLGWPTRLMVSLGAGLYEELLFRVVLVAALAYVGRRAFGWRTWIAGAWAVILGAFLFSAFHYIGPYGDQLRLYSFVFRMIAGLFFSSLYLLRGFGITAWTHALYDVFLLVT